MKCRLNVLEFETFTFILVFAKPGSQNPGHEISRECLVFETHSYFWESLAFR